MASYKINLLISTLEKERSEDPINGGLTTSMVTAMLSSNTLSVPSDSSLIEEIFKRNPNVIDAARKLDFSSMELIEPSKDELRKILTV